MTVISRDGHDISGTTANRPTNLEPGLTYYDTDIGALMVANASGNLIPAAGQAGIVGVVAAGTNQGTGTLLTTGVLNTVTSADGTKGVRLPVAVAGNVLEIANLSTSILNVYPATSGTINSGSANAGIVVQANTLARFDATGAVNWEVSYAPQGGTFGTLVLTGLLTEANANALTAIGTTQGGALALTKQINNITTSTAGTAPFNGVSLPAAAAGLEIEIINSSANAIQVYGAGTDTINGVATATGITMVAGSVVEFSCTAAGAWFSEGVGIGYSGSFPTLLGVDSLTAVGTTQGGALALTGSINRITTATATAAPFNGVRLPASAPGMQITIENSAANIVQVYGAGTDTINGIATATGVGQGVGIVATYCCTTAGNWVVQFTVPSQAGIVTLSGTADAISPHHAHTYVVTKAGVDAMTLAAPTATTDDGIEITITSSTSNAHTLTATGLLQTGTASVNLATFAAQKGAGLTLMAYQGKWQVLASVGITFS